MDTEEKQIALFQFLKDHPFQSGALAASSTIFLCSCIGFFREYLILKNFGINVVSYAELNDFLVAGLKDPFVLAIFPVILVFFLYAYYVVQRRRFLSSKFSKLSLVIALVYPLAIAFMYIPMFSVNEELESIKELKHPMEVTVRGGDKLGAASLISTTERFLFVWLESEEVPVVLPHANVLSLKYLRITEENVQQGNPADAEKRG